MTNQALYILLQQAQDFWETMRQFISNYKDVFLILLGSGILLIPVRLLCWLIQQRRKHRILPDTFPFDVIKPQSNVLQALLGGAVTTKP
jgi:hypothetical protein